MATLEELNSQLNSLKEARASGALKVEHKEKSVTFRSIDELNRAISNIKNEINGITGKRRTRQVIIVPNRGI